MDKISIKSVNLLPLIALPYDHLFMILIVSAWASKNDLRFRDFLYHRKTKSSIVLFSVLIGALLAFISFFDIFYFQLAIESFGKRTLSFSLSDTWLLFTSCIFKPFIEELFFRGFLYNFYKKKGILTAIIISSIFFSILHLSIYRVIEIFIIGVSLALLYEITQCFWIPVLVHGSINAISYFLIVEPVARFLKVLLYWLHGGNVWLFRLKLLLISIVLYILAILIMFLIMRISGNNIFQGKEFKNLRLINRDEASH